MRAAIVLALFLAGCASANQPDQIYDPLESVNREIFALNHRLDRHAAIPAASAYKAAVPDGVRIGVHNFFSNLTLPVSLANDLLQGELKPAGWAVCRFGVNTTVGVLGVMDPATGWGCREHDEDFGQTLAVYSVPGGPYLVLPLVGSTFPRDLGGRMMVDHYFNPLGYVTYGGRRYVSWGIGLIKTVDTRSQDVGALRDVERTSIDYYAAMRSIYYAKREYAIHNGDLAVDVPPPSDTPKP
jgi:phospholipid-binding lipoprotein MlaA